MKHFQSGTKVNTKCNLPRDFQWKLLRALIHDLFEEVPNCLEPLLKVDNFQDYERLTQDFQPRSMLKNPDLWKNDISLFYRYYQIGALLKKFPFTGSDTYGPALSAFKKAEHICDLFNRENINALLSLNEKHPDFLGIIEEIQADIEGLLGRSVDYSFILGHGRNGPGSTISEQNFGGKVTEFYKFTQLPYSVTADCYDLAKELISSDVRWMGALDHWFRSRNQIGLGAPINTDDFWDQILLTVAGSKLTSVPKNAKTDRFIAIEPQMNVMIQLGIDAYVRTRLRVKWGYDIDDQSVNQAFAQEGSRHNLLDTLDLTMASDTSSLIICQTFLPSQWFALLLHVRCWSGVIKSKNRTQKDEDVSFSKISSMGNGFTFALETLLFGAIVRASMRRTNSRLKSAVYGDDIVLPSTATKYCVSLLNLCGYSVNADKSFYGMEPFRESCGRDFVRGIDVRPFFLKKVPTSFTDLFYIHNFFYGLESDKPWYFDLDFVEVKALCKKYIPKTVRQQLYGPPSESLDTYLFSNRRLPRNSFGQRYHFLIHAKAKVFIRPKAASSKHYSLFFFLKLLAKIGVAQKPQSWCKQKVTHTPSGGSAFLVTRKGAVQYYCTKRILYS